jgi:hypothetical protein
MAKHEPEKEKKSAKESPEVAGKSDENSEITNLISAMNSMIRALMEAEDISNQLTGKERMRLIGAGVRNYGFMDKAMDIVIENPSFAPPNFDIEQMVSNMRDLEKFRQLLLATEKFEALVNECLLMKSTTVYREALRVYASLREQARNKVPGAEALFMALISFFKKRRRSGEAEPTMKELEHDFHSLLHGTADGGLEIVNESPKITEDVHKVVDDVHKGRAVVKETAEAELDK